MLKKLNIIILTFLGISICSIALASDVPDFNLQVPLFDFTKTQNIAQYIGQMFQIALYIIVPLAIVVIIAAGAKWILSGGDPGKIQDAKKYIVSAFIGLFIALFSYFILNEFGLTNLQTPGVDTIAAEELDIDLDISQEIASGSPDAISSTAASYKAVCAQYKGKSNCAEIAPKCKALGDGPPAGLELVSMGSLGSSSGQKAEKGAFERLKKSIACVTAKYPDIGPKLTASGWRSAAEQYAKSPTCNNSMAAKPCCSNHGAGVAFDMKYNGKSIGRSAFGTIEKAWAFSDTYLKPCFNANGLYANLRSSPNEPWHYSPSGH